MSLETLAAVWELDLSRNEKDVLEVLAWHANADGICWPSKARIMYTKSLSESTVKRTLGKLKKDGLISVEAHADGGRGRTPIYKIHPEKGVRKPPFEQWKREQKGVRENPIDDKRGSGETRKGVTAMTPEPTENRHLKEPSSSLHSEEERTPAASDSPDKTKVNFFTLYCDRIAEAGLVVSDEDRNRLPGNLAKLKMKHEATDLEMRRVVLKMVEARMRGYMLMPADALNDVRGVRVELGKSNDRNPFRKSWAEINGEEAASAFFE